MSHHHQQEPQRIKPYKTIAQTLGMAVCLFLLLFVMGQGLPANLKGTDNGWTIFIPLMLLPVVGFIISWFKELPGTAIMIAGGLVLMVYFIIQKDLTTALVYGLPFMIVGSLFLLHIRKRNLLHGKK
jgi:hypothetical protein